MTIEDGRAPWMEHLLSLRSISILFVFSFLLTAEEALHLLRSHPNSIDYYGQYSLDHHSGCIPRGTDKSVMQCPTLGYGSMILICNHYGCGVKEPSTGLVVDPMEAKRIRGE